MSSFTKIANHEATDKGTQTGAAHGYSLVYDMLMAPYRHQQQVDILEMGLAIGGPELNGNIDRRVTSSPSVNTWLKYFDAPKVVGFDISDFTTIQHDNFTFVRGDLGKRSDLEKLRNLDRRFDIIIDDASHASYHQQLALSVLFSSLKPGGLYIIEDMSWQPTEMENELPSVPLTSKLLSEFLIKGNCPRSAALTEKDARELEQSVASIWMFEESYLNAGVDSFNQRNSLPKIQRNGWRGSNALQRFFNPYFWLFSTRRFVQGLSGSDSVNWQSVKLAIIQKNPVE